MTKSTMDYKGYAGSVEVSIEDECLHGQILFIDDKITYEGANVAGLQSAFQAAVDRYLVHCEKNGKQPNKPFSGSFNVRTGPELHREAVIAARKGEQTLNDFVKDAIRVAVKQKAENRPAGRAVFTYEGTRAGSTIRRQSTVAYTATGQARIEKLMEATVLSFKDDESPQLDFPSFPLLTSYAKHQ